MKKIFLFFAVLTLFILAGVIGQPSWAGQTTWPKEYKEKITTRVYKAGYDKVFDAVVKCANESGYPVIMKNRESGIVLTDAISEGPVLLGRMKLDFNIYKVDEDSVKVRLYIHYEYSTGRRGAGNIDNFINEYYYRDFFKTLDKEINKKEPAKK